MIVGKCQEATTSRNDELDAFVVMGLGDIISPRSDMEDSVARQHRYRRMDLANSTLFWLKT
jgi:hypothetical protein